MESEQTLHGSSFDPFSMASDSRYCSSPCSGCLVPPRPLGADYPVLYLCAISLLFISIVLIRIFVRPSLGEEEEDLKSSLKICFSRLSEGNSPPRLPESLLLELPDSPKWAALFPPALEWREAGGEDGGKARKKKAKKNKRKRNQPVLSSGDVEAEGGGEIGGLGLKNGKSEEDLVYDYPFTSSSSMTQRKIKQKYDQLLKSHDSNTLTLAEVGQFVNCLVDAREELKQKSEVIKRKFTVTKAMFLRANRSSFDRLQKQANKLELEQKRLEEDTSVYNALQHQLKLSPAYQKIMEIGASLEAKAKAAEEPEDLDDGFTDISFEELLEQEKKDSFWQKHRNWKFR